MTIRPWLIPDRNEPWRDTIVFIARCPGCGADAVWAGHKTGGPVGATDTTYDLIDCPRCGRDWTVPAQTARRRARAETIEAEADPVEEEAA